MQSVTDTTGSTTAYAWNNKDQVTSITDPKGNTRQFTYDTAGRLTKVKQPVTIGGVATDVEKQYTYSNGRLSGITHNGFSYGFTYNAFGRPAVVSAAGTALATYTYKANNGLLEKVTYPDGSYIRTEYDSLDRPVRNVNVCKGAGTSAETVLEEFTYDRQGNLYHVNAARAGRTYDLQYDLLDRLCRVRDNDGCIYEYTYDKNSQMTRLYHLNGTRTSM